MNMTNSALILDANVQDQLAVNENANDLRRTLVEYLTHEGYLPFQEGRDGNFY